MKTRPSTLRSATFYRLDTADGYELLYRRLTNQHRTRKPDLGKLRTLSPRERKQSFSDMVSSADNSSVSRENQQLNPSFKDRLIDVLLKIPSFNTQENRSLLLQNLPFGPVSTVNRSSAPMIDIHTIVCAASAWGYLESGKLALAILIENALLFARGTELGNRLEALLAELKDKI